ncbi:hypothetical protein [Pyrobaculum sp.]
MLAAAISDGHDNIAAIRGLGMRRVVGGFSWHCTPAIGCCLSLRGL